jgi:hypothetical protein
MVPPGRLQPISPVPCIGATTLRNERRNLPTRPDSQVVTKNEVGATDTFHRRPRPPIVQLPQTGTKIIRYYLI